MKLCDLHTHSVYSDGTATPKEILELAEGMGLSAVALCDHNTVDGLPEFLEEARGRRIEAVPGVEFSVDYEGRELHLLGLYIPETAFEQVTARMEEVKKHKEQSNVDLVRALRKAGYYLDYDAIKAKTPNGKVNRLHIARAMTERGYTPTVKYAFDVVLAPGAGYYIEPKRLSVWEILDLIRQIGAAAVLAHPFLRLDVGELEEFLPEAKRRGLLGMECCYSTYDAQTTALSLSLAQRLNLLPSGGSDYHGGNKPDISLGTGRNNLKIPYAWAEDIRKAVGQFEKTAY